jgi:hypothetical protein
MLFPSPLLLLVLYFVSAYAAKKKWLPLVAQRKFWNALLLITFLVTGISGLMIAWQSEYGTHVPGILLAYNYHTLFGAAMTVIAFCHAIWHWSYFKSMIKKPTVARMSSDGKL